MTWSSVFAFPSCPPPHPSSNEHRLSTLGQLTSLEYLFLGCHVRVGDAALRGIGGLPRLVFLQASKSEELWGKPRGMKARHLMHTTYPVHASSDAGILPFPMAFRATPLIRSWALAPCCVYV